MDPRSGVLIEPPSIGLQRVDFTKADLSHASIKVEVAIRNSVFVKSDMTHFSGGFFVDCNLAGADLSNANLRTDLSQVDFRGAHLSTHRMNYGAPKLWTDSLFDESTRLPVAWGETRVEQEAKPPKMGMKKG